MHPMKSKTPQENGFAMNLLLKGILLSKTLKRKPLTISSSKRKWMRKTKIRLKSSLNVMKIKIKTMDL